MLEEANGQHKYQNWYIGVEGGGVGYSSLWVECKQLKTIFSYRQRKEENCCSWSSKQEGIFGFKI